jgi:pyruvate formate lyase activating enzyme
MPEREALFYDIDGERTDCRLCPWHCHIKPGSVGRCGVRKNVAGRLHTLNYAEVTSLGLDPIEKKPLYHFHPGSLILSLGTFGCNLQCGFCQNWQISQERAPSRTILPEQALELAQQYAADGSIGLAYTYNEPFIWYEFIRETAPLIRAAGLHNVLVTNGIVEQEPLEELLPYIDAMNVDIKSMSERFYLQHCKGQALPARQTVERAFGRAHVEITNLIIPGQNDSEDELRALVDWAASVSPQLPLHFSAYHPDHEFSAPATPPATLRRAYELAREKLQFVYVGNLQMDGTTDTACPQCGHTLIVRRGMTGRITGLNEQGGCAACGTGAHVRL